VQLLPLQNLDVILFQVETTGQNLRNFPLAVEALRSSAKFNYATVLLIIGCTAFLRDKVRVVLDAHGSEA